MSRIVADSSPLIVLACSGLISVLARVAGEILAPATVFAEGAADAERPGAQAIVRAKEEGLVGIRPDVEARWSDGTPPMLDAGELAALALARDVGCPVLMDEKTCFDPLLMDLRRAVRFRFANSKQTVRRDSVFGSP